jgi:hypothetical protein
MERTLGHVVVYFVGYSTTLKSRKVVVSIADKVIGFFN